MIAMILKDWNDGVDFGMGGCLGWVSGGWLGVARCLWRGVLGLGIGGAVVKVRVKVVWSRKFCRLGVRLKLLLDGRGLFVGEAVKVMDEFVDLVLKVADV